jgi:hypothetical protein
VVKGSASDGRVRLYALHAVRSNALTPVLRGRIFASERGGSTIVGVVGWPAVAAGFCLFWVALLATALVAAVIGAVGNVALTHWDSARLAAKVAVICLVFLVLFLAAVAHLDRSGRSDEAYLVDWINESVSGD